MLTFAFHISPVLLLVGSCCSIFSFLCFVDRCLSFCSFYFDHCIVCPSIYASDYHFGIFTNVLSLSTSQR